MHLWTEYEGRTVAEHYTLGKLLRSEGRNGFFATTDREGHPAVIRLTEAHFDEAEQLQRWRHVAGVHQANLIKIEQVGQTTFEGVALTYALMEPDDANLGDVLKERPLTATETMQAGKAVLSALKSLHENGLVHGFVEPANVLAVGDVVKLRSDCVRECTADALTTVEDCAEMRRRDLHDFGTLLLRCLTLEAEWSQAHNNLPSPFQRVIPRALDGSWTLEQLGQALEPGMFAAAGRVGAAAAPVAAASPATPAAVDLAAAAPDLAPTPANGPAQPKRPLVPQGVRHEAAIPATVPRAEEPLRPQQPVTDAPLGRRVEAEEPVTRGTSRVLWAAVFVGGLALLFLAWHFFSGGRGSRTAATAGKASVTQPAVVGPSSAETSVARAPVAAAAAVPAATRAGASGWYVIAYTYNHEGQAAEKAKRLKRTHNSMHPQVFTPSGHAPYFVSLGGAMSQGEAQGVYRHARRAGLPRDTFVRHY